MDTKKLLYGVFAGVLVAGLFGLYHINNLSSRIDTLEEDVTKYQSQLEIGAAQIEALNNQINIIQSTNNALSATITGLQDAIEAKEQNSTNLKAENRELEAEISIQQEQLDLLEDAVGLVGRESMEDLLWAYTEKSIAFEELQREYNDLLEDYYALLAQQ